MKRKKRKEKSIILRLLILGVCAYFTVTLGVLWGDLNDKRKELELLNEQYTAQKNNVEELRLMLHSDSDKQIIEKAARERLGYIYSNEQVFIDYSGS
jgi:cell division protein FtsB